MNDIAKETIVREGIRRLYRFWLETGKTSTVDFGSQPPRGMPEIPFRSLQEFLAFLYVLDPQPTRSVDLTFADLMRLPLSGNRLPDGSQLLGRVDIETLAGEGLCTALVSRLAWELAMSPRHIDCVEDLDAAVLSGAREVARGRAFRTFLAGDLWQELQAATRNATVRDLFMTPAHNGYRRWWPGASVDGRRIQVPQPTSELGPVQVDVFQYERTDDYVSGYEWTGRLVGTEGEANPEAVACGMLYRYGRRAKTGRPRGGHARNMIYAADAVADGDVLQVQAFLEQHADAEDLVRAGDIAFVWIWERREGSRKGAGLACLRAAMQSLKTTFPYLRTVVVDTAPYQFRRVLESLPDPGPIAAARLDAIDRVLEYVLALRNELGLDVRATVNRDEPDDEKALLAVGAASLGVL